MAKYHGGFSVATLSWDDPVRRLGHVRQLARENTLGELACTFELSCTCACMCVCVCSSVPVAGTRSTAADVRQRVDERHGAGWRSVCAPDPFVLRPALLLKLALGAPPWPAPLVSEGLMARLCGRPDLRFLHCRIV